MMLLDSIWIVLTGALVAGSCAMLGSFLVLRRMAMLGDAISHAVLPGLVIAFLISGSRGSLGMFVGAVAFGLLTAFLVQFLTRRGIQNDAALGVAFTFLFALGVLLVSLYGSQVDLDLDCVLYGEIAYTPFDLLFFGDASFGPRPLWINGALFVVNMLLVFLLYKQFKISSFDPGMAAAVGINVTAMHYLLMGLVSVTVVGAFESVGAILVVALLIVPPAAAYLLTDRLAPMIAIAIGIGALSSLLGYLMAQALDASIAGSIAMLCGLFFLLAFLFSPSHGILSRILARRSLSVKIAVEDALLWAARKGEGKEAEVFARSEMLSELEQPASRLRTALARLKRAGFISRRNGGFVLTPAGKSAATDLLRRHRLYESYLGDIGYPTDHIHDSADREEHFLSPGLARMIESEVGERDEDPQGKPIPDTRDA